MASEDRKPPVGRIDLPESADLEPVRLDFAGSTPSGTLEIGVDRPRRVWRDESLGGRGDPAETVLPLVVVNGRAVDLGEGRAEVTVPPGPALVEVMDDHRYTSRTVEIVENGSVQLWIGTGPIRQTNRIMLGPKGYAAMASAIPSAPGIRAALVCALIAAVLTAVLGPLAALTAPALTILAVPLAILAGFVPYRALRRRFGSRADQADPSSVPDPETVAPGPDPDRQILVLGPRMRFPESRAIVLRFAPDPGALDQIAVRVASPTGSVLKAHMSNGFEDWLEAPEVRVNGRPLPARWGTLWIPVPQGPIRLEVRLPGFRDPRRGSATLAPADAHLDLEPVEGLQYVDCLYNIVRLSADRVAQDSESESAWQRVLRRNNRLEPAERDADAPPLRLEAVPPGPIR